jgi:glycosyltransferase involved in cell wall biosynthesis
MDLTDVGLVLSTIEGYPCVAWELMAFGVPFVITPTGAAVECTANNPDTELASFSPEGVRNAIERLAERVRAGRTSRIRLQRLQRNEFSYDSALTKHLSYCLPEAKVDAA